MRAPASASRLALAEDGLLKYLAKGSVPDNRCDPLFEAKEDSESEWLKEHKSTWAALIKLIYESDALLCPSCHIQMKIISVIKDGVVIDKILDHLKYKFEVLPLSARPPPLTSSPCASDFPLDPPVWTERD